MFIVLACKEMCLASSSAQVQWYKDIQWYIFISGQDDVIWVDT